MSEELWKAANEEIDKERNLSESGENGQVLGVNPGKHVFSGKLVCGLCGAPF